MIEKCQLPFLIAVLLLAFSCQSPQEHTDPNQLLWYEYPAQYWNSQTLHLGNGYFGASFYGGVQEEKITLTEQSMWTGGPFRGDWEEVGLNPKALEALPQIRKAIVEGEIAQADQLVATDFLGESRRFGHFTTIGSLKLQFENHDGAYQNYRRSLDLEQSLGAVSYTLDDITYQRTYFCSYPDRILAMKLTTSQPEALSFTIGMEMMQDSFAVTTTEQELSILGHIRDNGRPFHLAVAVENDGGTVTANDSSLMIKSANSVVLYLTTSTNYKLQYPDYTGTDPAERNANLITSAKARGFEQLKAEHITDYQSLYQRSSISFEPEKEVTVLPTNERFEQLKEGNSDPGYYELAFNLGKYMLISSSRPGTLPANLQGVWNSYPVAPWAGNYQSNINLQEIYWPSGPANLLECQEAYIDWIADLVAPGREVAKRCYGTSGWISHTTGNIWGHVTATGRTRWGMFPMGSAWHCQHLWEQFAFNQEEAYLRETAYPIMKEAAQFWLENLIEFEGHWISAPTVSAEHGALLTEEGLNPAFHDGYLEEGYRDGDDPNSKNKYLYNLPGAYQDIEMIWDLFTNTAEGANLLGDTAFAKTLLEKRANLLPLKIGKHGQLQEWSQDIDHPDCHHRHIAHLYAVCPGRQIHPTTTPELSDAAKKSLNMRGDGRFMEQEYVSGGNWSRAHRMSCWTRLMDGDRAHKIMRAILTEQGFENLLTYQHHFSDWGHTGIYAENDSIYAHYQLDATAAITAALAEMVVQSHMGEIHLLPALPDQLSNGKATGLLVRGGYEIDITWQDGKLIEAIILSKTGNSPAIRLGNKIIDLNKDPRIKLIFDNSSGNLD